MGQQDKALYIHPWMPNLKEVLESLQPTPGFCIFVDIVGSTEMKDADIQHWILWTMNTFTNMRTYLPPFSLIRAIGDQLMFFASDARLDETGKNALRLFHDLTSIVREPDTHFVKEVKAAMAYCEDSYYITFVAENSVDYYGKDIDLTARLLAKASAREVVMNEECYRRLLDRYGRTGNNEQFPEVTEIIGPETEHLKGFRTGIPIYRLPNK